MFDSALNMALSSIHFALTRRINYFPLSIFGTYVAILNHLFTAHFSFCFFVITLPIEES